jgi:hypothetical protein
MNLMTAKEMARRLAGTGIEVCAMACTCTGRACVQQLAVGGDAALPLWFAHLSR